MLQLSTGVFPKPNFNNGTQYIASIPQPTQVREDVVRIDHAINSKFQLMFDAGQSAEGWPRCALEDSISLGSIQTKSVCASVS